MQEPRDRRLGALALIAIGLACQEVGAAFAVGLFSLTEPLTVVTFRLVFSALILLVITRPRVRDLSARQWRSILWLALALTIMNATFYLALARLDLGVTVTIEVLGPLVLSVVMAKRAVAWLWALLGLVGVTALGGGGWERLDPLGVMFAATAGAAWAAYILTAARVGREVRGIDGLALAMGVGALLMLPVGIVSDPFGIIAPNLIALGAAVAVLSSTIPYSVEMLALKRIPESTFAILMCLGPATAALAGWLLLGQELSPLEILGMILVIIASMGAVVTANRRGGPSIEPAV